jgi:hypothetical protein
MLKFLMQNRCLITLKEAKGDTLKEHILRSTQTRDTQMIDSYLKMEDEMIINRIFTIDPINKWDSFKANCKAYFRWNSPRFIRLFVKLAYKAIVKEHYRTLIFTFFLKLYLIHWLLYNGSKTHALLSLNLHFAYLTMVISLVMFDRAPIGTTDKLHIASDKDTNVIG